MTLRDVCVLLLLATAPLAAETEPVGVEYYIPATNVAAISDSKVMAGTAETRERWTKIYRTKDSTTLNAYAAKGDVKKVVVKKITEKKAGVRAMYVVKEGDIPADYTYSTADDNKRKVDEEYRRRKAVETAAIEAAEKAALAKEMGL